MLLGLLPLIGWAQEVEPGEDQNQMPVPYLAFDETTYAGDETAQPSVVDGWVYDVLDEEGESVEFVRDAGVYTVLVFPGERQDVRRAGDTALNDLEGEPTVGGDDTTAPVELTYTVNKAELYVRPNNTNLAYGDEQGPNWGFATGYWMPGDEAEWRKGFFTVEGLWYEFIQETMGGSVGRYTFGLLIEDAVLKQKIDGEWVENTNYELKTDNTALLIRTPRDISVSINCDNATKIYGYKDPAVTFIFEGFPVDEDGELLEDENSIKVYDEKGNPTDETIALDLTKIEVTREEGEIVREEPYLYTIATQEYTVSNRKYIGVKGISAPNYRFVVNEQVQCGLTITPRDIHSEGITVVVDPDNKTYDGNEWNPTFTITDDFSDLGDDYVGNLKTDLEKDVDYLAQAKGLHAGDKLEYWIDGIGNYFNGLNDEGEANPMTGDGGCDEGVTCGRHGGDGDDDFDEEVKPACLNVAVAVEGKAVLGDDLSDYVKFTITGWAKDTKDQENLEDILIDALDFSATPAEVNAGETVTISVVEPTEWPDELSDYTICNTGTTTTTFDPICISDEGAVTVAAIADQMYKGGDPIEPTVTVYPGVVEFDKDGKVVVAEGAEAPVALVLGTDYTVEYDNNTDVSTDESKAEIKITGIGNYTCDLTVNFNIIPANYVLRIANISYSNPEANFKSYGQATSEERITVEVYESVEDADDPEVEPKDVFTYNENDDPVSSYLPEGVFPRRYQGENVGKYNVAFFKDTKDNRLNPGKFEGEVETCALDRVSYTQGNYTVTLIPGLYEIIKNSTPLVFTGEIETIYGDRTISSLKTADIKDLFKEFKDAFKLKSGEWMMNDEATWIIKDGADKDLPRKEIVDITNAYFELYAYDKDGNLSETPITGPINENGDANYLPAGDYKVVVKGCTSVNYNLGEISLKLINQRRKISIWIDPMVLGPRDTFNEEAVTWAYQRNNEATDRGIALLDTDEDPSYDASVLRVPGNDDAKKFFNIKFRYSNKVELITLYVYNVSPFNPNYEPIVRRSDLGDTAGHFIIHRVAKDLQDNPWNDLVQKITAFDAETGSAWDEETPVEERLVEKVYFRTFDASQTVSSNLFDLFEEGEDGEWEPKTAEIGGELDTENGFPMYADKWYAMVLPFDCSVYELGHEFFQYGVINVLDESNTKDNVIAFKLQATGMIPANTPFCVKLGDMGQTIPEDGKLIVKNLDQMFFENKKIVAPRNEAGEIDFGCVYSEDASGVRFYGSYDGKFGFKANEYFFTTSSKVSTFNNYYYGSEDNTTWLRPSGSFLYTPEAAGARTIIMQEEDGSFTAIESIENIAKVNTAEGWFTTNGVKLNAQPTQKGVYIHNGKKIVVK